MKANKLILMACIALGMLCGCKARKVLTTRTDSAVTTNTTKKAEIKETSIDTGKKITTNEVVNEDSSTTTTEATPVPGKIVTINKDGSVTGEFTSIKSVTKKHGTSKQTEKTTEQKHESKTRTVDSTANIKQDTRVQKKIKSVESKPDYSWILWTAGGLLLIGVVLYFIWKKF